MQGCGYGFLPMMGGVSELVARLVVAMISMAVGSYALACFCDPAAWVTAAVFTGVSYLFVMKDIRRKYDRKLLLPKNNHFGCTWQSSMRFVNAKKQIIY